MAPPLRINPYGIVVDVIHISGMDEAFGTDVDEKYFDNHAYDDTGDILIMIFIQYH